MWYTGIDSMCEVVFKKGEMGIFHVSLQWTCETERNPSASWTCETERNPSASWSLALDLQEGRGPPGNDPAEGWGGRGLLIAEELARGWLPAPPKLQSAVDAWVLVVGPAHPVHCPLHRTPALATSATSFLLSLSPHTPITHLLIRMYGVCMLQPGSPADPGITARLGVGQPIIMMLCVIFPFIFLKVPYYTTKCACD